MSESKFSVVMSISKTCCHSIAQNWSGVSRTAITVDVYWSISLINFLSDTIGFFSRLKLMM